MSQALLNPLPFHFLLLSSKIVSKQHLINRKVEEGFLCVVILDLF